MSKLMHPQLRATSAAAMLVESRDRLAGQAQANDWIERGWNPFKAQEPSNLRYFEANPTGIERMRDESGIWFKWMWDQREKLRELAALAFEKTDSGKLDMENLLAQAAQNCWSSDPKDHELLDVLLYCGGDPSAPGQTPVRRAARGQMSALNPPLFEASRAGAQKLIKGGADPRDKGLKVTCWEAWALRATDRHLGLDDLDWMAKICPPSAGKIAGLPMHATQMGAFGVLERLKPLGLTQAEFGLEGAHLASVLSRLMAQGDQPEALESYAKIAGWPAIFEVMGRRGAFEPVDYDKLRVSVERSPLAVALASGRVKCLGVLEREGFLGPDKGAGLATLCASAWRQVMMKKTSAHYGSDAPKASGLVWAIGRLGKSGGPEALEALAIAASYDLQQIPRVVETCATKGWLPDSGPLSPRELFKNGEYWRELDKGRSFQNFMAIVEAKSLRSGPTLKKAPPAVRTRNRL